MSFEEKNGKDKGQYWRLVGKFIYLACTMHDLAYAISMVIQFMHDPTVRYLHVVDCVLQYLKTNPKK